MKRLVAILVVVVLMATLFAACGKSDPTGKYVVKSINGKTIEDYFKDEMGEMFDMDDMDAILGLLGIDSLEEFMTLELKSDNTAVMSSAGDDKDEGEWKMDGDKVIISFGGDEVEFTIDGSELKGKSDGQEVVFKKK